MDHMIGGASKRVDEYSSARQLEETVAGLITSGMARMAQVVEVRGPMVRVKFAEEDVAGPTWLASSLANLNIGTSGIVVKMRRQAGLFVPMHQNHPLGMHHWDKVDGIQMGPITGSTAQVIDPGATTFIAIGRLTRVAGSQAVAIGMIAFAAQYGVAIGSYTQAATDAGDVAVSVAVGYQAKASGVSSIGIGRQASATANNTTAIGYNATASAISANAFGYGATASGDSSVAIGYTTGTEGASGQFAIQVGIRATSSAGSTIAIGVFTKATGTYAIGIGRDSAAENDSSIAIGYLAKAPLGYGIALGRNANAAYANSTAIGANVSTTRAHEARVKADAMIIQPSSGRVHSKLGLYDVVTGVVTYMQISNGALQITTSW